MKGWQEAGAATTLASLLCGCTPSAEVRIRVDYAVDDHGVLRSGRAVWSNRVRAALIPLADKYESEFHGEAIPLTLPGRGVLLLMPIGDQESPGDVGTLIRRLFAHRAATDDNDRVGNTADVAQMVGQSRTIPCKRYAIPQSRLDPGELRSEVCLRFAFIANPKDQSTFRRAPITDGRFDGLENIRLRDARVTVTTDPVTRGLEQRLPWIPAAQAYWSGRLIRRTKDYDITSEIIFIRN